MDLIIDIGNTRMKAAVCREYEMLETRAVDGPDPELVEELLASHKDISRAILSSVRNDNREIAELLLKHKKRLVVLDQNTALPISVGYRSPETLGKDRIAAIVGAYTIFPKSNVLVIDLGTAITIDFIDYNGYYEGGNISPGVRMRFRALHEQTDRLPLMEPEREFLIAGRDTGEAIVSGVQNGILNELNGYLEQYKKRYPDLKTVMTGGDAVFFVNKLKNSIFVDQNLIFKGLERILDYNAQ